MNAYQNIAKPIGKKGVCRSFLTTFHPAKNKLTVQIVHRIGPINPNSAISDAYPLSAPIFSLGTPNMRVTYCVPKDATPVPFPHCQFGCRKMDSRFLVGYSIARYPSSDLSLVGDSVSK